MKIIPKEENLRLKTGNIIRATNSADEKCYFLVVESKSSLDEPRVYGLTALSENAGIPCGLLTYDGKDSCDTDFFIETDPTLLLGFLKSAGYTDIKKVTLEGSEV